MPDSQQAELKRRIAAWTGKSVPKPLAERVAKLDFLVSAVDIVRRAVAMQLDTVELGRQFFAIGARFRLDLLRMAARKLAGDTSWRRLAVGALVEDLYGHQADLTTKALASGPAGLDAWVTLHSGELTHLDALVSEILQAPTPDLAMLTVANRQLRALVTG